jgi:hypothetical protein
MGHLLLPPPPSNSGLRVREEPGGFVITKTTWKIGGWPGLLLILCGIWVVHVLYQLVQFAQPIVARQGLAALAQVLFSGVCLPASIGVAVLALVTLRSTLRLADYWQLVLQADEWQLKGLFGLRTFGRVVPTNVKSIVHDSSGVVMAEGEERWARLSGQLSPAGATWLCEVLNRVLEIQAHPEASRPAEPGPAQIAGHGERTPWPLMPALHSGDVFPPSHLASRPGHDLRFELRPEIKPCSRLASCGLLILGFLVLNGVISLAFTMVLPVLREKPAVWLAGVAQLVLTGWAYLAVKRMGQFCPRHQPRLEISSHPLVPGQPVQAGLYQAGPLPPVSIRVVLECEEKASFTDGTITRHSSQEVYRNDIWSAPSMELGKEEHLNELFSVRVPEGAMHSLACAHNWITWRLVLEEEALSNGRKWSRGFPVLVVPQTGCTT